MLQGDFFCAIAHGWNFNSHFASSSAIREDEIGRKKFFTEFLDLISSNKLIHFTSCWTENRPFDYLKRNIFCHSNKVILFSCEFVKTTLSCWMGSVSRETFSYGVRRNFRQQQQQLRENDKDIFRKTSRNARLLLLILVDEMVYVTSIKQRESECLQIVTFEKNEVRRKITQYGIAFLPSLS